MRDVSASVFLIAIILLIVIPPATEAGTETGSIHGILTDSATGEPVTGASVLVVGTQDGAITDSDGTFRIYPSNTGKCEVRVSHLDYRVLHVPDLIVNSDSSVDLSLKLTKRLEDAEPNIRAIRDTVENLIEGLKRPITNARGEVFLVSGYTRAGKVAYMVDSVIATALQTQPVSKVETLLEKVTGIKANSQGEIFIKGGRAGEVAYVTDGPGLSDPLGGLGQAGANLVLVTPRRISGSVVDNSSKQPLRNVSVIVIGTNYRTVTDAAGKFEIKDIPNGPYEILLSRKGYKASKVGEVSVGYKTTTGMRFELGKLNEK